MLTSRFSTRSKRFKHCSLHRKERPGASPSASEENREAGVNPARSRHCKPGSPSSQFNKRWQKLDVKLRQMARMMNFESAWAFKVRRPARTTLILQPKQTPRVKVFRLARREILSLLGSSENFAAQRSAPFHLKRRTHSVSGEIVCAKSTE